MSVESLGYGAGGSVLSALLVWAGFKQRLDRQEHDLEKLKENVVYKDTCSVCHNATLLGQDKLDKKLDQVIDMLRKK